jgi:membrane protease YdiL (CAAX protease family)
MVLKWVVYLVPAVAATILPIIVIQAPSNAALAIWFVGVPLACIIFLNASKAEIRFSWSLFREDVSRAMRFLVPFAGYHALVVFVLTYFRRGSGSSPGLDLNFLLSNIGEELLFRATLIPAMELLERRLFDSLNQKRIVAITALAFGLCHLGAVIEAPSPLMRYAAIQNVLAATVIGIFLGNLYVRTRNFPSVLAIHWWINLEDGLLGLLAYSLLG